MCRNLIYSRNEAAVLLLQIIYFWTGTVTHFPGPALVPSPTGPAASSPPERCPRAEPRVLSQALMPQCHRGLAPTSIPVIPSFLFLRNILQGRGMVFYKVGEKMVVTSAKPHPTLVLVRPWSFLRLQSHKGFSLTLRDNCSLLQNKKWH